MHILLGILSAIGVIGVILWRINMAANTANELAGAARDAKGLFRRWRWQRKHDADLLAAIDDPREAAVAMMMAIAEFDGTLSERERDVIISQMMDNFEIDEKLAGELLARGRWLAKDVGDISSFLRRLTPPIDQICSDREKRELINMLQTVAKADGTASDVVEHAIDRLRHHFVGT